VGGVKFPVNVCVGRYSIDGVPHGAVQMSVNQDAHLSPSISKETDDRVPGVQVAEEDSTTVGPCGQSTSIIRMSRKHFSQNLGSSWLEPMASSSQAAINMFSSRVKVGTPLRHFRFVGRIFFFCALRR
jgi:hypothetical protein